MSISWNKQIKKLVSLFLKISLSGGALWFVFTKIEFSDVLALISKVNPWLLFLSIMAFAASKFVSAIRFNVFTTQTGMSLDLKKNLKLYLVGMFYNLFLPGGIGGDGYKIYILGKAGNSSTKDLFWATLLDRLSGVAALSFLALFIMLFTGLFEAFWMKGLIFLLIPVAIFLFNFLTGLFFKKFKPVLNHTNVLSFGVQVLQVLSAYFLYSALGGKGMEAGYLLVFLISSIVSMLPVSIGGAGLRELTFLYGSELMHLDTNISVSLSLLFYLISAFVSLFGIFYSLKTKEYWVEQFSERK